MAQNNGIEHIARLAALGESVLDLVKESGMLRRKPGRKKGVAKARRKSVEKDEKSPRPKRGRPKKKVRPIRPTRHEEPEEEELEEEDPEAEEED